MIFSEYLGIDSDYVIVGLAALVLILFIVTIVNIVQMSKLKKKYKKFMSGKDARTLDEQQRFLFLGYAADRIER